MSSLKGKVLSATGLLDPSDLGVVMTHEHLLVGANQTGFCKEAEYGLKTDLTGLTFDLKNLGKIRQFPYSVTENLSMSSKEDVVSELKYYREAGGNTICDVTPKVFRYGSELFPEISRETGINIILGTAYYVDSFIPDEARNCTVEQIAESLVSDIRDGIQGSGGVKCGIIGEMGCSYPLTPSEEKNLKAAALAQKETGAPLIIHPGRDEASPSQILDVLEAAGADISHTVMSHMDRSIFDDKKLLEFARRGCYLEYDLFGIECSHYQLKEDGSIDFPSDAQKIQKVKLLVDNGYASRLLLAQDIHTKHRLVKYGGHGYAHVLEHIVPKMRNRGISEEHIRAMLEDNPQRWLAFS